MSSKTEPLPGTSDLFAAECARWRLLETAAHEVFSRYGYGELRTPVIERADVFLRTIGDETDIVQKEMYTFSDRGGRRLTLRPEGTAGIMRALANAGLGQGDEKRVYSIGPMFRGERPAAGRRRQFHQIGVECVGRVAPAIDAECIDMLMHFLDAVGIRNTRLRINSRGVSEDRRIISAALRDYFSGPNAEMCEDCRRRLRTNVWRILDCKVGTCRPIIAGAPAITELLTPASRAYFDAVCKGLDTLGIDYDVDPRLIRGLDYYVHTVFEVVFEGIGAQNSIAGGGRYAVPVPGVRKPVEGVGFAAGGERLLLCLDRLGVVQPPEPMPAFYLVGLGEAARNANQQLAAALRRAGAAVLVNLDDRGLKGQMKRANKCGARFAVIRGEAELADGRVLCKDLASSEQISIPAQTAVTDLCRLTQAPPTDKDRSP